MKLNILYRNLSSNNYSKLINQVQDWYFKYGIELNFLSELDSSKKINDYHILMIFQNGISNSGGAGDMNIYGYDNQAGGRRDKDSGCYPINLKIKEVNDEMLRVAVHEIMHCLHFQFNLGDIHSLPDGANMGNGTIGGNEKAMDYFLKNAKRNNKPSKIIIHHTASKTWNYREVLDFHIKKGWQDIGYHIFIEKNGIIKRGRWDEKEGAHTIGENTTSIGICLAGNFNDEYPTNEQHESLKYLIYKYKLPISFHKDFANTDCPGKNITKELVKNDMLKLIQEKNREEVYAVINGKNYYISGEAFEDLLKEGLVKWEDIKKVDEKISLQGIIK